MNLAKSLPFQRSHYSTKSPPLSLPLLPNSSTVRSDSDVPPPSPTRGTVASLRYARHFLGGRGGDAAARARGPAGPGGSARGRTGRDSASSSTDGTVVRKRRGRTEGRGGCGGSGPGSVRQLTDSRTARSCRVPHSTRNNTRQRPGTTGKQWSHKYTGTNRNATEPNLPRDKCMRSHRKAMCARGDRGGGDGGPGGGVVRHGTAWDGAASGGDLLGGRRPVSRGGRGSTRGHPGGSAGGSNYRAANRRTSRPHHRWMYYPATLTRDSRTTKVYPKSIQFEKKFELHIEEDEESVTCLPEGAEHMITPLEGAGVESLSSSGAGGRRSSGSTSSESALEMKGAVSAMMGGMVSTAGLPLQISSESEGEEGVGGVPPPDDLPDPMDVLEANVVLANPYMMGDDEFSEHPQELPPPPPLGRDPTPPGGA